MCMFVCVCTHLLTFTLTPPLLSSHPISPLCVSPGRRHRVERVGSMRFQQRAVEEEGEEGEGGEGGEETTPQKKEKKKTKVKATNGSKAKGRKAE